MAIEALAVGNISPKVRVPKDGRPVPRASPVIVNETEEHASDCVQLCNTQRLMTPSGSPKT